VIVTDTLNGHTIEDVRRELDGSVTFYCDSGRTLNLHVLNSKIEAKPRKLILDEREVVEIEPSERMRLLRAFQGFMVKYAVYDDHGFITFVCEPLNHNREVYKKSTGHREICLTHKNGLINELPPVSAIIAIESLSVLGEQGPGGG